ncbi:MAG: putative S-layer protein, partial [archaeon]
EVPEICDDCDDIGTVGNLDVKSFKINVVGGAKGGEGGDGFGDDEDFWYPFDEVEIKFDVENKGSWDIENIEILFCLWDEDEGECVLDEGDVDISEDDFDLKWDKDDEQEVIISFTVDPDSLNQGSTDYTIYVTATGTIDDKDAEVNDGEDTCAKQDQDIEIRTDERFVVIRDFEIPETAAPGETITISADLWNIGDEDIDEDDIFIRVMSDTLKIQEEIEVGDLDSFDSTKIQITLTIPEDAQERFHTFEFAVYDDEDMDDNDLYENEEGDEAIYDTHIKVEGESQIPSEGLIVSATLQSGGKAGQDMVIKSTLLNTGSDSQTYAVSSAEHASWANSVDVSESSVIVPAGASKDITFTFDVKKDASGENTFYIEVLSGNQIIKRQAVSVDIEKAGFNLADTFGDSWYIWLIGALNVILVVIIIVVAIRVTRS